MVLLCEVGFWVCVACVVYPYLVYPLLLALWARLRGRAVRRGPAPGPVSFVLAVHNEEPIIERRLTELTELLDRAGIEGEILVVCDGCTDATAALARPFTKHHARILELADRGGKARALSLGVAAARHGIVVFADARQTWAADALQRILENFADPDVGAVSGDLVLSCAGDLFGVGLYWRFEKWLRRQESRVWAQVGVTGAISAVRRELFRPIPPGTVLDDVFWPLHVALAGKRVVHDSRAVAFDSLPQRAADEFRRKVRTLAGNFQLATRVPAALVPWRNPVWLQLVSHKLLRLAVPWALLALLTFNVLLCWGTDPLYRIALEVQLAGYGLGLVGLLQRRKGRLTATAASFLVLNGAAWVAFWVWASGRAGRAWQKAVYCEGGIGQGPGLGSEGARDQHSMEIEASAPSRSPLHCTSDP